MTLGQIETKTSSLTVFLSVVLIGCSVAANLHHTQDSALTWPNLTLWANFINVSGDISSLCWCRGSLGMSPTIPRGELQLSSYVQQRFGSAECEHITAGD